MVDLSVTLSGVKLDNPVIPASGTFGYGQEFAALYDLDILGSISFKGTTAEPRFGNPTPRIAETPAGMLNAVGLQNPGIDAVIAEELPQMAKIFHKPLIANIGGFSVDEYVENCRKIDQCDQVGIIEVNISCPNLHCGGKNFGTSVQGAAEVTKAVRAVTKKPIYMKLTPNVTDIAEIARACEAEGADGVSLINTVLGMRINLKTRRPLLANRTGGLSGPALLPIAVRMVYEVYDAVKIPIIGMGGVSSAQDVAELMLAGATAVQVGAANLKNPYACKEIIEELPTLCERMGVQKISELTGGAHG
jgi:dihydroorotate dehydrogenase (NAD+) catalytic subunit